MIGRPPYRAEDRVGKRWMLKAHQPGFYALCGIVSGVMHKVANGQMERPSLVKLTINRLNSFKRFCTLLHKIIFIILITGYLSLALHKC